MRKFFTLFLFTVLFLSVPASFAQNNYKVFFPFSQVIPEGNASDLGVSNETISSSLYEGYYYLMVQFYEVPSQEVINSLKNSGIKIGAYYKSFTYEMTIPASFNFSAFASSGVRSVFAVSPELKIAPEIRTSSSKNFRQANNNEFEVKYDQTYQVGSDEEGSTFRVQGVSAVEDLARKPYVRFIYPPKPEDEAENFNSKSQHGTSQLANPLGRNLTGDNIYIGVGDDGVIEHYDFDVRILSTETTTNAGNHGDHVAGTIAGAGHLNPKHQGQAPKADLLVDYYSGIIYATSEFASDMVLTNNSYSESDGECSNYGEYRFFMNQTMDKQLNRDYPHLLHCFAASNDGTITCNPFPSGFKTISSLAATKNILTIGATNSEGNIADFSSKGPTHDGRLKPDMCADGSGVTSTIPTNTYGSKSGTSMATPNTTGTLALAIERYKQLHNDSTPRSDVLKSIAMNTATDKGNAGPDFTYGYGVLNGLRLVENIENEQYKTGSVTHGNDVTYTINLPAGLSQVKVMLYWHDYEGVPSTDSTSKLINNLDLELETPSSTTYLPWVLNPNSGNVQDVATRNIDSLNNVEQITLDNPEAGIYTITVKGSSVPQGPQNFAISYDLVGSDVRLLYPHANAVIRNTGSMYIQWEAPESIENFTIKYSSDSGATWNTLSSSVNSSRRYYVWSSSNFGPETGNYFVAINRNGTVFADTVGPFSLMDRIDSVGINSVCANETSISWTDTPGAESYNVYRITKGEVIRIGETTDTTFNISADYKLENAFSVTKVIGDDESIRAFATISTGSLQSCAIPINEDISTSIETPTGELSPCINATITVSAKVINHTTTPASGFNMYYQFNDGAVVSESFAGTLNGEDTVTFTFATASTLPTVAGEYVTKVWSGLSEDDYNFNDTSTTTITVYSASSLPFEENFDVMTDCGTPDCGTTCELGNGWINNTSEGTDWSIYTGQTATGNTGPSGDTSTTDGSGKYIYIEASSCNSQIAEVTTPCIDLTTISSTLDLSFFYHMYGSSMGELHLDIYVDGAWQNDIMTPIVGNQGNKWVKQTVNLLPYKNKFIQLRWRGIIGGIGSRSDMAIDEILIDDGSPAKLDQTITFNTISDKTYNDPSFSLGATASSSLAVSYTSTGPISIDGSNNVTITGAGSATITAKQAGNGSYNPAPDVQRSFTINKDDQTITFNAIPNKSTSDIPFEITPTSSSGLSIALSLDYGPASISDDTIHLNGTVGEVSVSADQAGNANYNAASTVTRIFQVQVVSSASGSIDASSIVLKPNPVSDKLIVQDVSDIENIYIVDNNGKRINLNYTTSSGNYEVDLTEVNSGHYVLILERGDEAFPIHIIKE